MLSTTTTPPNTVRANFPLKPNEHLVDDVAAAGYALFVYPDNDCIILEGDPQTVDHAMMVFTGGCRAS